ncbi:MAG: helix-turn-helix transcriptional regulator [Lachnospiraceae bacterium]|nr:helix-turn-helix transcriptional regulator [Lachnospiraceae bacterium]
MALSEKLYALRKKSGLSQEQLAEQLSVSRQAISKWEAGQSVPESDKLLTISNYFNVSLDYLMKEDEEQDNLSVKEQNDDSLQTSNRTQWLLSIIICIGGIICLIIWGLLSIFNPATSNQISESSMIHIDGNLPSLGCWEFCCLTLCARL